MTKRARQQLLKKVSGHWPIVLKSRDTHGNDDGGRPMYIMSHEEERMFIDFGNSDRDWFVVNSADWLAEVEN